VVVKEDIKGILLGTSRINWRNVRSISLKQKKKGIGKKEEDGKGKIIAR
jgi:hypothetical protein